MSEQLLDLVPEGDHFIVKPDAAPDRSDQGVLIPEMSRDKITRGTVVAIGPGVPEHVKVGKRLTWLHAMASDFKWNGEGYLLMHATDVAAWIVKE